MQQSNCVMSITSSARASSVGGAIRPRVAGRTSFDEVVEAHRRLEAGGLERKLVLRPDLPSRREQTSPQRDRPARDLVLSVGS
jgi:hypothetical protein